MASTVAGQARRWHKQHEDEVLLDVDDLDDVAPGCETKQGAGRVRQTRGRQTRPGTTPVSYHGHGCAFPR
ncbi:hypothetical protein FraQA3DRAFT_2056 [Frankia sp. QA3]|nr:hypothetical protein FraQA3DRAFT_2056 [Frankia sp. QA3]